MALAIEPSPLESKRFNISAGKLTIDSVKDVTKITPLMNEMGLNFVSTRINSKDLALVQALEQAGFILTDTLVYYKCALSPEQHGSWTSQFNIREAKKEDHPSILDIARLCFTNYVGHYHADPKFDKATADEVYIDWTRKSCEENFLADVLLVSEEDSIITSYITLKKNGQTAQAMVGGVHPNHQSKGLYRELIRATKKWALHIDCNEMIYSTQITNHAVQKVWAQEGSYFFKADYTLHYWL